MAVILNKGRITSTPSVVDKSTYTRPSDWTDLPALSQGDEKVYLLVNVGEKGGDYIQLKFAGDYTVDWGDGTANTNHSSGTEADHEFLWANAPSSSLTSQGYRQVIVTITAQGGSTLTAWNLNNSPYVPSGTSYNGSINHCVCRVKMAGTNFTNLSGAFRFYKGLKEFEYVGTNNVTNAESMFRDCVSLSKIVAFDTSNIQSMGNLFNGCTSLIIVPQFDLSSCTNASYLFSGCSSIYDIPKITLPSTVTNLTYVCRYCSSLQEVPFTNLNHVQNFNAAFSYTAIKEFNFSLNSATNLTQMFWQTFTIQTVKFSNIPVGQLTDISYCFGANFSLSYIKPFDTSGVTNFRNCFMSIVFDIDLSFVDTSSGVNFESMFEGNYGITDARWLNITTSATNVIELFYNCKRLNKYPTMDLTNCTSLKGTFGGNYRMIEPPTLNNASSIVDCMQTFQFCYHLKNPLPASVLSGSLTTVREMYYYCLNIQSVPAYDLSAIVAYANSYRFCYIASGLKESLITTHKSQTSYANCGLSRTAIVDIFNNLQTNADGRTIYVGANPGSPQLTAADLLIATNKGWTVSS